MSLFGVFGFVTKKIPFIRTRGKKAAGTIHPTKTFHQLRVLVESSRMLQDYGTGREPA